MGKVKGKHRLDKYYRLAKEHGYRSRAAWKLVQIDAKFTVLRSSRAVLDLCAAPGGWMQAAVERVPVGSLIIGIDLVPIAPIRGAISIQEDITKSECRSKIKRLMSQHGTRAFDLILHDGSPNVGGAWASEAMSQNALVIDSVRLATQFLAPKGNFISKVFRSQDYSSVLYCIKQLFEKVEVYKPPASRSTSAEIYILGLKYKAPAKIDPRLLDVKHLFQGVIEPRKVVDVLRGDTRKRHRDGYEDGDTILRKVCSAADFVWSETPLEILGTVTSISFEDPACLPLKDHTLTTEEVKILCDDLRVLGKQDFKYLLKWRMQIRKALSPTQKATPATTDVDSVVKLDDDEKLLNEMEELTYAMDRKKKREKKIAAKRREKDKMRKATGGMQVDATEDSYTDHELFSLSSIKGKKDLAVVDSTEGDNDDGSLADSENEETHEEPEDQSDIDSDEERKRYDDEVEQILDQAYERFAAKQGGSAMQRKRVRLAYSEDGKHLDNEDDDTINSDPDLDDEGVRVEANPLMVSLDDHVAPTQDELTRRWFNQDIFSEAVVEGDLDENASEDEMEIDAAKKKPQNQELKSSKAGNDFEIVPAPETDSSDSPSSDEDDVQTKAEVLACAKKMLRKKMRETLLDDAYNKYMHDDDSFLPKWFLEDEKRHWRPTKQVTKEEIAAERAQFKLIDARPAKKVAEAKARKKRVAARKLDKVRKKANTISDQADISDLSKRKMIDQLYKKAMPKRPQKEYVVAKKGVQVRTGKGKVLVDRRMKKDSRGNKQGKGGKKGKNGKGQKGGNKGSAKKGKKMEGGAGGGYKGRKTKTK